MSRKHFEALARLVKSWQGLIDENVRARFAAELADYCASQSERFDRARFLEACRGVGVACPVKWTGQAPQHPGQACPNCGRNADQHSP